MIVTESLRLKWDLNGTPSPKFTAAWYVSRLRLILGDLPRHAKAHGPPCNAMTSMAIGGSLSLFWGLLGLGIGTASQKISEFLWRGWVLWPIWPMRPWPSNRMFCLEMSGNHDNVHTFMANQHWSVGLQEVCWFCAVNVHWDLSLNLAICSGHAMSWISYLPLKHSTKGWNSNADVLQVMM